MKTERSKAIDDVVRALLKEQGRKLAKRQSLHPSEIKAIEVTLSKGKQSAKKSAPVGNYDKILLSPGARKAPRSWQKKLREFLAELAAGRKGAHAKMR